MSAAAATATLRATLAQQDVRREQWNARAITLAEEAHLMNRARYLGTGVRGESLWQVPSKSTDAVYVVHVWAGTPGTLATMSATCGCTAGSWNRSCAHAGSALLAERQKQSAEHEPSRYPNASWEWWMRGGSY